MLEGHTAKWKRETMIKIDGGGIETLKAKWALKNG